MNFKIEPSNGVAITERDLKGPFRVLSSQIGRQVRLKSRFDPGLKRKKKKKAIDRARKSASPKFRLSDFAQELLREDVRALHLDPLNLLDAYAYDPKDEALGVATAVVVARVLETGQFILTLDTKKQIADPATGERVSDRLSFPGGHREEGESTAENAARELLEETGIDIEKWNAVLMPIGTVRLQRRRSDPGSQKRAKVFATAIPKIALADLKAGEEQETVRLCSANTVDFLADQSRQARNKTSLTPNQRNIWYAYKSWCERQQQ